MMLDLDYTRRHIIFNGLSDSYFDLAMISNTPLLTPNPKRSSVEVPYANGTIDTSEIDGELYFDDLSITYEFICQLPINVGGVVKSTAAMNVICTNKVDDVTHWLYSGPATLVDYGITNDLQNAECVEIKSEKSIAANEWLLKFTVKFEAPFNMSKTVSCVMQYNRQGRFIVFNGFTSYNFGMVMTGSTPVLSKNPKVGSMSWKHRDGSLNLTHIKDGNTHGENSEFFHDYEVTYTFAKKFDIMSPGGVKKNACTMNREMNDFVERVYMWLLCHSSTDLVTIDGFVSFGGESAMLMDSAWIAGTIPDYGEVSCRFLPSARVTAIKAGKTIASNCWVLALEVTFTTYPEFFYGNLNIPRPTDPDPSPSISFNEWHHYAETFTNERYDDIFMVSYNSEDNFYMGPGIYISHDNVDLTRSYVYVDNNDDYVSETYRLYNDSSPIIYAKLELDVTAMYHDSIANDENKYALMITLPDYIEITSGQAGINQRTLKHLLYFSSTTSSHYQMVPMHKLIATDGEDPSDVNFNNVIFVDDFNPTIEIALLAVSESGVVGGDHFTNDDLSAYNKVIEIPMTAHYIQKISGDDVLSDYGLWGDYDEYTPENYYILKEAILNYSSEEMEPYAKDTLVPYNTATALDDVKFKNPARYFGTGAAVILNVPVVNGNGNNYIFCDRKKPEGGDIQCL